MKNIVTLTIGMEETMSEPYWSSGDVVTEFELDDERTLYVIDFSVLNTTFDTISDLKFDVAEESGTHNAIQKDLKRYFNPPDPVKRNLDNLISGGTEEIYLLFEEHFEITETENGPEGDYWCEYLGILAMETLTVDNCLLGG